MDEAAPRRRIEELGPAAQSAWHVDRRYSDSPLSGSRG